MAQKKKKEEPKTIEGRDVAEWLFAETQWKIQELRKHARSDQEAFQEHLNQHNQEIQVLSSQLIFLQGYFQALQEQDPGLNLELVEEE